MCIAHKIQPANLYNHPFKRKVVGTRCEQGRTRGGGNGCTCPPPMGAPLGWGSAQTKIISAKKIFLVIKEEK